jgi:hypothetical protein
VELAAAVRAPSKHPPAGIERPLLKALEPAVQARRLLEALTGVSRGDIESLSLVRELAPQRFISGLWEAEVNVFGAFMRQMDLAQLRVLEEGLAAAMSPPHSVGATSLLIIQGLCGEIIDGNSPPASPR